MLFYYIMIDPDKPKVCKLGITKNPIQRLSTYRTAAPNCYFLETYKINDKCHEKKILTLLKDIVTVRSEVVYCDPAFVKNVVEGYMSDNDVLIS